MQYSFDLRRKLVEAWQNWARHTSRVSGTARRQPELDTKSAAPLRAKRRSGGPRASAWSGFALIGETLSRARRRSPRRYCSRVGPTPPRERLDGVPRPATNEPTA
jgi:hypothetical protein